MHMWSFDRFIVNLVIVPSAYTIKALDRFISARVPRVRGKSCIVVDLPAGISRKGRKVSAKASRLTSSQEYSETRASTQTRRVGTNKAA